MVDEEKARLAPQKEAPKKMEAPEKPIAALSNEEKAREQALASIDPKLLNSLSWGGANIGSGVNAGVTQDKGLGVGV